MSDVDVDVIVPHGPMVKPYRFQPQPVKAILDDLCRRYCNRAVMYTVRFDADNGRRLAVIEVSADGRPVEVVSADLGPMAVAA